MRTTFKQFLTEMHYGSLVDEHKYNSLDKDDQALYKYTADGFTHLGHHMESLISKYPYDGGVLYRGLHFDSQEQHDEFLEKVKSGSLKFTSPSSWTPSLSTAKDFAHSKKSYFPTPELMHASRKKEETGDHMTGYGGVILKTKVGKGVGVDVSKSEFAKEPEVVLNSGTYDVEVQELLEPYHRKYDTPEKVSTAIAEFKKAKKKDTDLDRIFEYVYKSWFMKGKLSQEDSDGVIRYARLNVFSKTPEEVAKQCFSFNLEKDFFADDDEKHGYVLRIDAAPPFSIPMYEKASDKMKKEIMRYVKAAIKELNVEVQKLMANKNIDKILKTYISQNTFDVLRHFDENAVDKALDPLKKHFGKMYQQLNTREYNRTLDTDKKIRKHAVHLQQILSAITNL